MTDLVAEEGRILVVDDDPLASQTLDTLLRLETRFERLVVNDPRVALAILRTTPVDVVLSDFLMPGIDGLALLAEARTLQPEASRVLLTGYADKESAVRAINEVGLYHYVEKPWDNQRLLLVLRNAVERTRMLRALHDRDAELDGLRQRLWKALL